MNISLTLSIIDELRASANFLDNHLSWSVRDALKEKTYDKTQSIYLDLSEVKKENCELLGKLLVEKKYNGKTTNNENRNQRHYRQILIYARMRK